MVHTNKRSERGQALVISRWPIKVATLPDESLSSWLIRSGLANFIAPMPLSLHLWDKWRAWTRDVDRRLPPNQLEVLSTRIGIPKKLLSELTLSPSIKKIEPHSFHINQRWFWVSSLSNRNRFRKNSSAFCPLCLKTDPLPYFRKSWRFSWVTSCEIHNILLESSCPHCKWPIHLHMHTLENINFSYCTFCNEPLYKTCDYKRPDPIVLNAQSQGMQRLSGKPQEAKEWFNRLQFFVKLVRRSLHARTNGLKALHSLFELDIPFSNKSPLGATSFSELSIADRYELLKGASYLQQLSTKELIHQLQSVGLTQGQLVPAGIYCPDSLANVKNKLIAKPTKLKAERKLSEAWPRPRPEEAVARLVDDIYKEIRRRER